MLSGSNKTSKELKDKYDIKGIDTPDKSKFQ